MKKVFVLLLGAMMWCTMGAQVMEEGESALVYYSPKTAITVDFTYSIETHEQGIYSDFAEAMLGTDAAETENRTVYTLQKAQIGTATSADYSRPHKVLPDACVPMLLTINEKGVLKGYNLPAEQSVKKNDKHKSSTNIGQTSDKSMPITIAPFSEEVLEAATPLAQANAVAKQIFRIRETRMYLLNGEVEHLPADGQAMKLVLEELDKQEKALTELFVGKKSVRTEHKRILLEPTEEDKLLYFSEENGFTNSDNLDADTIRIKMALHAQSFKANDSKKKKKGAELSQIVYNLPGSACVSVSYEGGIIEKRTVAVAQLGVDVPIAKDVFTRSELPIIVFNEKTGNIVSISK
ncbi:MAG: DUF4831 family protein [Paludibacteraceae bacterium]|nr:DUF4831 family protein [Paludibacteraceae bacterium]